MHLLYLAHTEIRRQKNSKSADAFSSEETRPTFKISGTMGQKNYKRISICSAKPALTSLRCEMIQLDSDIGYTTNEYENHDKFPLILFCRNEENLFKS